MWERYINKNFIFLVKVFFEVCICEICLFIVDEVSICAKCGNYFWVCHVISLDSWDIDDDCATLLVIGLVGMREFCWPWLSARLSLEQIIDGALRQSDQLVLRGRIMVPHGELHPLGHVSVIELWLSLEFGVQVIIDLFRLSDHFPPVILVLLNEADGITLTENIHVFQLLALDLTSEATTGCFDHFPNLFLLF